MNEHSELTGHISKASCKPSGDRLPELRSRFKAFLKRYRTLVWQIFVRNIVNRISVAKRNQIFITYGILFPHRYKDWNILWSKARTNVRSIRSFEIWSRIRVSSDSNVDMFPIYFVINFNLWISYLALSQINIFSSFRESIWIVIPMILSQINFIRSQLEKILIEDKVKKYREGNFSISILNSIFLLALSLILYFKDWISFENPFVLITWMVFVYDFVYWKISVQKFLPRKYASFVKVYRTGLRDFYRSTRLEKFELLFDSIIHLVNIAVPTLLCHFIRDSNYQKILAKNINLDVTFSSNSFYFVRNMLGPLSEPIKRDMIKLINDTKHVEGGGSNLDNAEISSKVISNINGDESVRKELSTLSEYLNMVNTIEFSFYIIAYFRPKVLLMLFWCLDPFCKEKGFLIESKAVWTHLRFFITSTLWFESNFLNNIIFSNWNNFYFRFRILMDIIFDYLPLIAMSRFPFYVANFWISILSKMCLSLWFYTWFFREGFWGVPLLKGIFLFGEFTDLIFFSWRSYFLINNPLF